MTLDQDIEIVNIPKSGIFKIVQLFLDSKPIMICGPTTEFHKKILVNFLSTNEIKPDYFTVNGKTLPSLKGERYEVVGMGRAEINKDTKWYKLPYGGSVDYPVTPNPDFREKLKEQFTREGYKN